MKRYRLPKQRVIEDCFKESSMYVALAKDYIDNPDEYVREITAVVNGKLRHLVTYQPSSKGGELRRMHAVFSKYLRARYKSAISSFAYIEGKSFVDCVKCHLYGTTFLKADIRGYFDSISPEKMLNRLRKLRFANSTLEVIELITKACFFRDRLPIGFVSSPILSDLFLVDIDRKYQRYKKFVYTRYADDFIISANGPESLEKLNQVRRSLMEDLDELDLELNRKKTYIRQLSHEGDAIRVLGVNIVKTDTEVNKLTISDRYLRQTCIELGEVLSKKLSVGEVDSQVSTVCGRISFIKQCSGVSYAKFRKMVLVKCDYSGELDAASLRAEIQNRTLIQ